MIRRCKKCRFGCFAFSISAVLICTLGILIVLLVIAVKAADSSAQNENENREDQLKALDELQFNADSQALKIEVIEKSRSAVASRLTNQRLRRGHIQEAIRNVEAEQRQLLGEIEQFQSIGQSKNDLNEQASTIEQLKQAIAAQNSELEKKIAQRDDSPTSYAIVPSKTANGTNRRPIYLECTSRGVTIQPGGQIIGLEDLSPPVLPGNPLDAALMAIREYWVNNKIAGDEGDPYPLLIVRPGGSSAYALARRAMKSWDEQFGYELVKGSRNLTFGEPDEQLNLIVSETIVNANRRRAQQIAMRLRHAEILGLQQGGSSKLGGYRVTPNGLQPVDENGRPTGSAINSRKSTPYSYQTSQEQITNRGNRLGNGMDKYSAGDRFASGPQNERGNERGNESGSERGNESGSEASGAAQNKDRGAGDREINRTGRYGERRPASSDRNRPNTSSANFQQSSNSNQNGQQQSQQGQQSQPSNQSGVNSMAAQRGANWALPDVTAGATAYRRPIRITLGKDRLTIQSGASLNRQPDVIRFEDSTEQAMDALVQSIWKMIDEWGIADARGYWKPELKMTVERGAEPRLTEIMQLMKGSGLIIVGGEK